MRNILTVLCCLLAISAGAENINTVDSLFAAGQYREAIDVAEIVAADAEACGDLTNLLKARSVMAEAYIELGDEASAHHYLTACTTYFNNPLYFSYQYSAAHALFQISKIYRANNDLKNAEAYLDRSVEFLAPIGYDNVLAIRYCDLADIQIEEKDYNSALASIERSFACARDNLNATLKARQLYLKALCMEGMGNSIEASKLLEMVEETIKSVRVEHATSFSSVIFLRLASEALSRGDSLAARNYADNAVIHAQSSGNRIDEAKSYDFLDAFYCNTDPQLSSRYRMMADSLSYEPYIQKMAGKLAFHDLEFARRERDQKIQIQTLRIKYLISTAALLGVSLLLVLIILRVRRRVNRFQKGQIKALRARLDQREKLLAIAKAIADPAVRNDLSVIAGGMVDDLPVKLTSREFEIARLAAEGLQNKEIAARLGISTRTVEAHRNNVYRKLGISSVTDLRHYLEILKR